MREYTWNTRAADLSHHRRFRELTELHELTLAWIQELKMERAPYLLARGLSPAVADQLWVLDTLNSDSRLETLLDDTSPDDVLGRLEHTVWAVQGYTLAKLLEKTPSAERPALESALEQASWKLGRRRAEERWQELAAEAREDLRALIRTTSGTGILLRRSLREEAWVEFLACPHRRTNFPELAPIASELCVLHGHWLRGFAYGLNNRIAVEPLASGEACGQRWRLIQNVAHASS